MTMRPPQREQLVALASCLHRLEFSSLRSFAGNPITVAIDVLPSTTVRRPNPKQSLIHTPEWQLLLIGPRYLIGHLSRRPGCIRRFATLSGPFMVCAQLLLIQGCFDFKATGHIAQDLGLAAISEG